MQRSKFSVMAADHNCETANRLHIKRPEELGKKLPAQKHGSGVVRTACVLGYSRLRSYCADTNSATMRRHAGVSQLRVASFHTFQF